MKTSASCRLLLLIPHGNTIAELNAQVLSGTAVQSSIIKGIILQAEADTGFRDLWKFHIEKHRNIMAFRTELSFSSVFQDTTSLLSVQQIKHLIPGNRQIVFTPYLEPVSLDTLISETDTHWMIWGFGQKGKSESAAEKITCKTFQIAAVRLELSDAGLLTWQVTDSCWAPRS